MSRLGAHQKLRGDTTETDDPSHQWDIPDHMVSHSAYKVRERWRKNGIYGEMAFVFSSHHQVGQEHTLLGLTEHLPALGKWGMNSLFCFPCVTFPFPIKPPFSQATSFLTFALQMLPCHPTRGKLYRSLCGMQLLAGVKDSPFQAHNMELKDFKITTDLIEMCQMKRRAVIAAQVLIDRLLCLPRGLLILLYIPLQCPLVALLLCCCLLQCFAASYFTLGTFWQQQWSCFWLAHGQGITTLLCCCTGQAGTPAWTGVKSMLTCQ